MISSAAAFSAAPPLLRRPSLLPPLSARRPRTDVSKHGRQLIRVRRWKGVCRADLAQDAPFVAAIGACVLNSIVFPVPDEEADGGGGAMDSTDARIAVMGLISFIPYFNWMGWVFAWLDSGRQRYIVYAAVYLAPYLRTNLSLSPEESWLPIASILFCIIHVQLEASIRNGDLKDIPIIDVARKLFAPLSRKKESQFESRGFPKKGASKVDMELPSAEELRDEFNKRRIPQEPFDELHGLNEKPDIVDTKEHDLD